VIKRLYVGCAIILTNTILLLLVVNAVLYPYISYRDKHNNPIARYTIKQLLKAYPGWTTADLEALEDPAWNEGRFVYDPITQVQQAAITSRYLNVSNGLRRGATDLPWPPDKSAFNIFVFGGSTTFGIGVPDWDTIPSAMQRALRGAAISRSVNVYNMGRPGFASTGELLVFLSLLDQGVIPDVAIFIDGFNDSVQWDGIWGVGPTLSLLIDRSQETGGYLALAIAQMPLVRATRILAGKMRTASGGIHFQPRSVADEVIQRWLSNKKLIEKVAAAYNVNTCFVWQPVPVYNYDLRYDMARDGVLRDGRLSSVRAVYGVAARFYSDGRFSSNVLYLADIQKNMNINLYVDAYHYTAEFSREIASRITQFMASEHLLTTTRYLTTAASGRLEKGAGSQ
jgi:hypothetical protein